MFLYTPFQYVKKHTETGIVHSSEAVTQRLYGSKESGQLEASIKSVCASVYCLLANLKLCGRFVSGLDVRDNVWVKASAVFAACYFYINLLFLLRCTDLAEIAHRERLWIVISLD